MDLQQGSIGISSGLTICDQSVFLQIARWLTGDRKVLLQMVVNLRFKRHRSDKYRFSLMSSPERSSFRKASDYISSFCQGDLASPIDNTTNDKLWIFDKVG
jgi:hypothetical protein